VEKHGGGLRQCGFKVGYLAIVPLTFNGCIVSVLLPAPTKKSSDGSSSDVEWKIYDLQIPFGSAMFICLDTYHSILNGPSGNVRYSCLLLTTKTAFVEEPVYFCKKEPTAFQNLISVIPRYLKWAHPLSTNVYNIDVPVEGYKRFVFRVLGSSSRHGDLLVKYFLKDYRYFMKEGELQKYFGFQNVFDDEVHKKMVESTPSQLICDDDNQKKKNNKEKTTSRADGINKCYF
jgi:hypothetical protein